MLFFGADDSDELVLTDKISEMIKGRFEIDNCPSGSYRVRTKYGKPYVIIGIYTVRYSASKIKTDIRKIHRMPVSVCGICRYGKSVQTLFSSANHLKYSSMRFVTSRSRSGSLSHIWISRDTGAAKDIESRAGSLFRIMPLSIIA